MQTLERLAVTTALALVACSCGNKDDGKNQPAKSPAAERPATTAPAPAKPTTKPAPKPATDPPPPAATGEPIAKVMAGIATGKGTPQVCFGWSAKTRTIACHVYDRSIQSGGTYSIELLSATKTSNAAFRYFKSPQDQQFLDDWPAADKIDKQALARASKRLASAEFAPWKQAATELRPNATIKIGGITLKRTRKKTGKEGGSTGHWDTFEDMLHFDCGAGKEPVAFPTGGNNAGNPTAMAYALHQDLILVTVTDAWSIEGDNGASASAHLLTTTQLCSGKQK